jgi:hypothetical protein
VTLAVALVVPSTIAALGAWAIESWTTLLGAPTTGAHASSDPISILISPLRRTIELLSYSMLVAPGVAIVVATVLAGKVPWRGERRAVSMGVRSVVISLVSSIAIAALGALALRRVLAGVNAAPNALLGIASHEAYRLLALSVVTLVMAGAVDLAFAWRSRVARLRMTDAEVRREHRETYGAPETREARARVSRDAQ